MSKEYAILRINKLSVGKLRSAVSHNQREVVPQNADAERIQENIDFFAGDSQSVLERWETRMAESGDPKVRVNATAAIELFCGFSPQAKQRIDPTLWGRDCGAFAAKVFGEDNIISHVVHCDEKTPHCSILVIPLIKKSVRGRVPEIRLAASHWTDGPKKLEDLQTLFWEHVGTKYDLQRGERGSHRKHIPQTEMYAIANNVESVITSSVESIPHIQQGETEAARIGRIKEHLKQDLGPLVEAAKQVAMLQFVNAAAAKSDLERRKEIARRKKAEEEKQRAEKIAGELLKERDDRLRDIPVSLVLRRVLGMQARQDGNRMVYETPAIKISVHADEQQFAVLRGNAPGGSGAISAVMQVVGCDYRQAVRWLGNEFHVSEVESSLRWTYEGVIHRTVANAVSNPITVSEKLAKFAPVVDATWHTVREYLVRARNLPGSWIDGLRQDGHVWSNDHGSACFSLRDMTGKIVGASVCGTTRPLDFRQTIRGRDDGFFRLSLGKLPPTQVAVVGSPIEAISLASIQRSPATLYVSSSGATELTAVLDAARSKNWSVIAAQKDDVVGEVLALQTAKTCDLTDLKCVRMRPPFFDWNDTLMFVRNQFLGSERYAAAISKQLRSAWSQNIHASKVTPQSQESISLLPESPTQDNSTILL